MPSAIIQTLLSIPLPLAIGTGSESLFDVFAHETVSTVAGLEEATNNLIAEVLRLLLLAGAVRKRSLAATMTKEQTEESGARGQGLLGEAKENEGLVERIESEVRVGGTMLNTKITWIVARKRPFIKS